MDTARTEKTDVLFRLVSFTIFFLCVFFIILHKEQKTMSTMGSLHHISVALFRLGFLELFFWRCSMLLIMEMFECFSWVTQVRLCELRLVGSQQKWICIPWTVCDQKYIWCVLQLTFNSTLCAKLLCRWYFPQYLVGCCSEKEYNTDSVLKKTSC